MIRRDEARSPPARDRSTIRASLSFPSGRQFDLAFGDQRAVVVEVGGGLRSYSVGGRELVDGYRADEPVESGRGQVLIPWPNRVRGGRYEFGGRLHQLALTEPENGNAIHGLVRWAAWNDADREPHRVAMEHTLHPQPGYPFSLELRIEYELSETGLAVRTRAANVRAARCPFGAGAHPYVTLGTASVDPLILHIPARTVLDSDEHGVPIGTHPVAVTDFDFREARPIADTKLDHAFTDLERDGDDLARVTLSDPETAAGLTVWVDESYGFLMLYTGDPRPDVARRSLAVEPMTCPPNAFQTREALVLLEPGDTFTGSWGIAPA